MSRTAPPWTSGRRRRKGPASNSPKPSSRSKSCATASTWSAIWPIRSASGVGSDAGADHARSAAVFLSGAHPEKGSVHAGMTMDQVLAEHIGQDTPLPSIELAHRRSRLELRLRLRLRLLQHHLLAHAHAAAAHGEQPAGGLRAAVRRWQQHRAAPGAETAGPQHSRFGHRQGGAAPGHARSERSGPPQRVSRRHPRNRAPHPEGRRAVRQRSRTSPKRPSESPRPSRITSSSCSICWCSPIAPRSPAFRP